jgi:hypothetical protein
MLFARRSLGSRRRFGATCDRWGRYRPDPFKDRPGNTGVMTIVRTSPVIMAMLSIERLCRISTHSGSAGADCNLPMQGFRAFRIAHDPTAPTPTAPGKNRLKDPQIQIYRNKQVPGSGYYPGSLAALDHDIRQMVHSLACPGCRCRGYLHPALHKSLSQQAVQHGRMRAFPKVWRPAARLLGYALNRIVLPCHAIGTDAASHSPATMAHLSGFGSRRRVSRRYSAQPGYARCCMTV